MEATPDPGRADRVYGEEIARLYGGEFDFPRLERPPLVTYMVATLPRSGSNFFCFELWRTGIYGSPLDYLNIMDPQHIVPIARRLGAGNIRRYFEELRSVRTSGNGVFGFKAFVFEREALENVHHEILDLVTPQYTLYLTRKDVLAHAVSIARAIQTGAFFSSSPEQAEPKYVKELIDHSISWIASQSREWEARFDATETSPLRITYEDLLSDPNIVLSRVGDLLGAPLSASRPLDIPPLTIQRDDKNREWIDRYVKEGGEVLDRLVRSGTIQG